MERAFLETCCDTSCQCSKCRCRKVFGKGVFEALSDVIRHIFGTNRESVRNWEHLVTELVVPISVKCSKETGSSTFCRSVRHVPDKYAERVFR